MAEAFEKVSHNLHMGEHPRMPEDRKADAHGSSMNLWFYLRRRRTSDGYTRLEGYLTAPIDRSDDGTILFTVYLTDKERRSLAKALLEGLETPN